MQISVNVNMMLNGFARSAAHLKASKSSQEQGVEPAITWPVVHSLGQSLPPYISD